MITSQILFDHKSHILEETALTKGTIITRSNYEEKLGSEVYVQNLATYLHNLECIIQSY